ncbi:hypothetical protein A1O3_05662 [Capronia epimyces CBS 606.96]|uniref:Zn(2)-C6 fungal-type domain-containing protein n=1 Tax=Capronia epimyces CBS 606.96 TaxID=1182542 RepID=W9XWQ9_9EURO|nr:uncharacterized protein A1O3_05662 [Capronia epimyces CBS 606.96]EXJ84987.1 hypothetical protein A1O3_05662 [Capronia epimyces CBS 606.96]
MPGNGKSPVPLAAAQLACRKRKAHRKSRLGCRNCKLRRVKCDEKKPLCEKCLEFGVVCNYDPSIPDLQPRTGAAEVGRIEATLQRSPTSSNRPILEMINASLREDTSLPLGIYPMKQMDYSDLARLERFQSHTVLTVGAKSTSLYFKNELVPLACSHLFLMHLIQSVTAAHDRFLSRAATSKPSQSEAYHMSKAVRAFQYKLSHPIRDEDGDALLGAAALLGVSAFFGLEASSVEDVWPFVDDDLGWLKLSDGKKAVWKMVSPLRVDSIWQHLGNAIAPQMDRDHRPSVFDHLYCDDLDSDGAPSTALNPYRNTAQSLAPLLDLDYNDSTWPRFISFICYVDPYYKALLEIKDPWAMLMLAYWYVKVCRGPWWICTRAILQGQAIVAYLERHCSDDTKLQEAIKYPRDELALAQKEGWGGF